MEVTISRYIGNNENESNPRERRHKISCLKLSKVANYLEVRDVYSNDSIDEKRESQHSSYLNSKFHVKLLSLLSE